MAAHKRTFRRRPGAPDTVKTIKEVARWFGAHWATVYGWRRRLGALKGHGPYNLKQIEHAFEHECNVDAEAMPTVDPALLLSDDEILVIDAAVLLHRTGRTLRRWHDPKGDGCPLLGDEKLPGHYKPTLISPTGDYNARGTRVGCVVRVIPDVLRLHKPTVERILARQQEVSTWPTFADAAKQTKISENTLRGYHRQGLLPTCEAPARVRKLCKRKMPDGTIREINMSGYRLSKRIDPVALKKVAAKHRQNSDYLARAHGGVELGDPREPHHADDGTVALPDALVYDLYRIRHGHLKKAAVDGRLPEGARYKIDRAVRGSKDGKLMVTEQQAVRAFAASLGRELPEPIQFDPSKAAGDDPSNGHPATIETPPKRKRGRRKGWRDGDVAKRRDRIQSYIELPGSLAGAAAIAEVLNLDVQDVKNDLKWLKKQG